MILFISILTSCENQIVKNDIDDEEFYSLKRYSEFKLPDFIEDTDLVGYMGISNYVLVFNSQTDTGQASMIAFIDAYAKFNNFYFGDYIFLNEDTIR